MNKKSPLLEYEDNWITSMGALFPGERVVIRGKDLFQEYKKKSWMHLLLYTVTGREFTDTQVKLFESIWTICTSYSDPRIWNNRISAIAGTARSTASLAIGSSIATSEASIYGRRPDIRVATFLLETEDYLESGYKLDETVEKYLKKFRGIPGYSRPLINADERIKPLMEIVRELNFENGKYLNLAFEVEDFLLNSRRRMKANIAAITAGLAIDQGLTPREYYHYAVVSFSIGFLGCFVDANDHAEGSLFPLSCERISYQGAEPRKW